MRFKEYLHEERDAYAELMAKNEIYDYEKTDKGFNVREDLTIYGSFLRNGRLPVKFYEIHGYFKCSYEIENWQNLPEKVYGDCVICVTAFTDVQYLPHVVGSELRLSGCNITSLVGISDRVERIGAQDVPGKFIFSAEKIKKGGLGLIFIKHLGVLGSNMIGNLTPPFKIIEKYLGRPDQIFDCQQELIENGFEEFAIL